MSKSQGPLGHAFQEFKDLGREHTSRICHCGQPASAHKAEESALEVELDSPDSVPPGLAEFQARGFQRVNRHVAPEPADKAGASAEAGKWSSAINDHINQIEQPEREIPRTGRHVLLDNLRRAAEAAARREEREEIIKAIETGLRLNLPLFVVAGRVRARGGSGE